MKADNHEPVTMDTIVSLAKRRGFVFPGSGLYGGLANTWDYGPLGVEMKRKIRNLWWRSFVQTREDVVGIEAAILMNPRVWQASGHVANFNDAKIDCRKCKMRYRADHLIEQQRAKTVEGKSIEELNRIIQEVDVSCPNCGAHDFTAVKKFNLLFETKVGSLSEEGQTVYLRGETAQAMFVNFKNILEVTRKKLPFGIAQIGKAFRNEITPGNFIFRTLEFEQMEIEYFLPPDEWEKYFHHWQDAMWGWLHDLGVGENRLRIREHQKEELSHYSKKTVDIEYQFPFGWKELYGLAYRTDFDLKNHQTSSGQDLCYHDRETGKKFLPHVIEPTFGVDRTFLTLLLDAYNEEEVRGEKRVVLRLNSRVAPYQVAILPLSKKAELQQLSKTVFREVMEHFDAEYDETQSIGRRYRRQDEIGTPYCVTIDFESPGDQKATVRDRDSMEQERIAITQIKNYLQNKLTP